MAKRKVVWTTEARLSLKEILDYYTERNGNKKYSSNISHRIKKLIAYISSYNLIGRAADEKDVRVVIYDNYEIFYQIGDKKIEVLLVWDSRRNPKDLKLK
jgi:plasmid stabilization system protein ParE